MKKIILVNGLIAGAIVSAMLLISMPLHKSGVLNHSNGMWVGYTSMVIALSMIFIGIKTYRDQYENGSIAFWQAVKIGLAIAGVASLIYAITWEFYYSFNGNEFMESYSDGVLNGMKRDGATTAELDAARTDLAAWNELYKNPFIRFAMTLLEIVPVGVVISFIAAGVLRKKAFLPA